MLANGHAHSSVDKTRSLHNSNTCICGCMIHSLRANSQPYHWTQSVLLLYVDVTFIEYRNPQNIIERTSMVDYLVRTANNIVKMRYSCHVHVYDVRQSHTNSIVYSCILDFVASHLFISANCTMPRNMQQVYFLFAASYTHYISVLHDLKAVQQQLSITTFRGLEYFLCFHSV